MITPALPPALSSATGLSAYKIINVLFANALNLWRTNDSPFEIFTAFYKGIFPDRERGNCSVFPPGLPGAFYFAGEVLADQFPDAGLPFHACYPRAFPHLLADIPSKIRTASPYGAGDRLEIRFRFYCRSLAFVMGYER